jgi:hypothetical protein
LPNLKIIELAKPWSSVNGRLPNMPCHPVGDRRQESTQLRWRSLGDHLNAAIGQVPYEPANFKTFGQPSGGFPKADPLDMAAIQDLASFDHR